MSHNLLNLFHCVLHFYSILTKSCDLLKMYQLPDYLQGYFQIIQFILKEKAINTGGNFASDHKSNREAYEVMRLEKQA